MLKKSICNGGGWDSSSGGGGFIEIYPIHKLWYIDKLTDKDHNITQHWRMQHRKP